MDAKRYIMRDRAIRDCIKTYLDTIEIDPDKPMEIIARPYKKDRSDAQNRLMWKWLSEMVNVLRDEHGIHTTSDSLKWELQDRFLGYKTTRMTNGTFAQRLVGTSELNVGEFTEFLNRVERYANGDLGIPLTHPADSYYEALGK